MKFFEKKKKPVYDMADQSFVASVLDALNLSHGDAVLEISKDSVLSESYFANRYGAYVKHLKTASEFTGGFFELSVMIDVVSDFENLFEMEILLIRHHVKALIEVVMLFAVTSRGEIARCVKRSAVRP